MSNAPLQTRIARLREQIQGEREDLSLCGYSSRIPDPSNPTAAPVVVQYLGFDTANDLQKRIDYLWDWWRYNITEYAPPGRAAAIETSQDAQDALDRLQQRLDRAERWANKKASRPGDPLAPTTSQAAVSSSSKRQKRSNKTGGAGDEDIIGALTGHHDYNDGHKYRQETRDSANLESLLYRGEEAWHRSNPQAKWQELEGPLDNEQRYWRGLIGGESSPSILLDARFTLEQAVAAYDAAMVLASARTQTLLLLNELPAARRYASDVQTWHDKALLDLNWTEIAQAREQELAGKEATEAARPKLRESCVRFMNGVIAIHELLSSRVDLIDTLQQRHINGLEYVETVRSRQDSDLMVLLRE